MAETARTSDDSDHEMLHDTVTTVLLSSPTQATRRPHDYITQDTQILDTPSPLASPRLPSPRVQVLASSPLQRASPFTNKSLSRGALNGGLLANAMAPPGTSFRAPLLYQAQPQSQQSVNIVLSDDDDNFHHIDSSDDDRNVRRADIKPSVFVRGDKPVSMIAESPQPTNRFAQFSYAGQKRPASAMADDGPAKRQTAPSRAHEEIVMELSDIPDASFRPKVERMRNVYPQVSVYRCYNALAKKRGNYEDALDFICAEDTEREKTAAADTQKKKKQHAIDLTASSDVESPKPPLTTTRKLPLTKGTARRQVENAKSISEKWSSKRQVEPSKTINEKWSTTTASSGLKKLDPAVEAALPQHARRRLVQGRKEPAPEHRSSSPAPSMTPARAKAPPVAVKQRHTVILSDDEDSGVASETVVGDDADDGRVLEFINTCSREELLDTTNAALESVELVLSSRPFTSMDALRGLTIDSQTTTRAGKTKIIKKNVGERIADVCEAVLAGYAAVDDLVAQCEKLGEPIAAEMKAWGFNAFGGSGELEMTDVESGNLNHDSGMGTPNSSVSGDEGKQSRSRRQLLRQPQCMSAELKMKDYQVAGLNWLALLFSHKLSCILADDMGLGKTCQVIAFLSHLTETGTAGPHLVVVPGSTLENWLREFQTFSPTLRVEPYYGSQAERGDMAESIEAEIESINVIVTTYDMASKRDDAKFLRRLKPVVCVYDEGHALKNSQSKRYKELMRIPAEFRLLLTGTPLQNNLQELVALLAFIMPHVFRGREDELAYIFKHKAKTTEADHSALLSDKRIRRARSMMTPFILRRKKHQVLQHLPKKTHTVEYCDMNDAQRDIYKDIAANMKALISADESDNAKAKLKVTSNILMDLRKAAIHPLLFRRVFTDAILRKMSVACLGEPEFALSNPDLCFEDMQVMNDFELQRFCLRYPHTLSKFARTDEAWMQSGKVSALARLLTTYRAAGDRALVFSQFTLALDILEQVLETLDISFVRLDGATRMQERQDVIDLFHRDTAISVFLLSTKAGGAGINLACANRVVVFDSGFNPQEEVQAENRAHRVGQTRDVEVVRLVSRGTIEEQILALGASKLALDERVAGEAAGAGAGAGAGVGEAAAAAAEREGEEAVARAVFEQLAGAAGAPDDETKTETKTETGTTGTTAERDLKDAYAHGLEAAGVDLAMPARRRAARKG